MNFQYWDEIIDIALIAAGMVQSMKLSHSKKEVDRDLHTKECEHEFKHHHEERRHEIEAHLLNILSDLERHFQQLNADLISSTREAERDMFDQRSQQLQTLTIAATIMLTALISVLIQGTFQYPASEGIYILYALSNASSLAALVVCIVLCTEIIGTASTYMYLRSKTYHKSLRKAIVETRQIMRKTNDATPIAQIDSKDVDTKWIQHEQEVAEYMNFRDEMNRILGKMLGGTDKPLVSENEGEMDFASYWDNKWRHRAGAALLCFYLGTGFMIVANILFMWVLWLNRYNSSEGAALALVLLIISGLAGLFIFIVIRYNKYLRGHWSNIFELLDLHASGDDDADEYVQPGNNSPSSLHVSLSNTSLTITPDDRSDINNFFGPSRLNPTQENFEVVGQAIDEECGTISPPAIRVPNRSLSFRVTALEDQDELKYDPLYEDNLVVPQLDTSRPYRPSYVRNTMTMNDAPDWREQSRAFSLANPYAVHSPLETYEMETFPVIDHNPSERRRYRSSTLRSSNFDQTGESSLNTSLLNPTRSNQSYWWKRHKS